MSLLPRTTFECLVTGPVVGEKMLDGTQQVTSKAASRSVGVVETVSFQQSGEELVSQIPTLVFCCGDGRGGVTLHKHLNGRVVSFTQRTQRVPGFG